MAVKSESRFGINATIVVNPESESAMTFDEFFTVRNRVSRGCAVRLNKAGLFFGVCSLVVLGIAFCFSGSQQSLFAQEASAQELTGEQSKFFETKIRPVLARECYGCHSTRSQVKGGLWLDTKGGSRDGGDSGPAIVPGDLDDSLLWNAINHVDYKMPPGKKLSEEIRNDFRQWIEMGAPDPRTQKITKVNTTITPEDIEQGRDFWAFKKPVAHDIPEVKQTDWPTTGIDRFVLSELERNDLQPSSETDASTFLRRISYDLVGLPPTPEQVAWLSRRWETDRQAAIEKIVDSLIAKPEFGETWGRHWLDVARFAESSGKELNLTYPQAWRYRDYVIDSLNDDKPYDRFIQEQIAGDLLPVKSDKAWSENLVATGFLAIGPKTLTEQNGVQFSHDLIDEQIDVATRVVLGVSVACARCHDHKFDPIPQSDYYAMAGIFKNTTTHYGTLDTFQNRRPSNLLVLPVDDLNPFDKKISTKEMAKLKSELADKLKQYAASRRERQAKRKGETKSNPAFSIQNVARLSAEVAALRSRINSYDEKGNPYTYFMGVQSTDKPTNARLLVRGEFDKPAQAVERGFPQVLMENESKIDADSSGRLELARWMGSDDNPLTARVMVNRVWQHLLGNGLVRTPENFGSTGQPPTHPELLDHLAVEFVKNGWSVKQLVREITTSKIYRTSSKFNKKNFQVDPENKLVWRVEPRRLSAEAIRDSILQISGQLDSKRPRGSFVAEIGPALVRDDIVISTAGTANQDMKGKVTMGMGRSRRSKSSQSASGKSGDSTLNPSVAKIDQPKNYRSVYLPVIRDSLTRAMDVFDFAEPSMVVGTRESSNTPDQGLFFLNNEFVLEQSDLMAERIVKQESQIRGQVNLAFLLAYGREASDVELKSAEKFYEEFEVPRSRFRKNVNLQKLSAICHAILASAEFRFIN
jgi:cytochrome c553